jgi:O-succinylbenzoate synthase
MIMTQGENTRPTDQETIQLGGACENLEHLSLAARLSKQLAEPTAEAIDPLPRPCKRRLERKFGSDTIRDLIWDLTVEEAEMEKQFSPVEGW